MARSTTIPFARHLMGSGRRAGYKGAPDQTIQESQVSAALPSRAVRLEELVHLAALSLCLVIAAKTNVCR